MAFAPPKEITEPVSLCGTDGLLNSAARGWARRPLFSAAIEGPFLRRKRWNFVFVRHPEVLVAAAMSHADYAGLGFVWLYDLKQRRFLELEHLSPLGFGVKLGDAFDKPAQFITRPLSFRWQPTGDAIDIDISAPAMKGKDGPGDPLELKLKIHHPADEESFNLVVPWSDLRFNYTGKLMALAAEGQLVIGKKTYALDKKQTLASIDFTRGVWPYHTTWHWACGAGFADGRRIGLNFGAGWSESAGVLENALYIDGRVVPLWEPVKFEFDAKELKKPWTLRTVESDRVALTFTPNYSRAQDANFVIVRMKLQQVMGHFTGHIDTPGGRVHLPEKDEANAVFGIAENHLARW